MIQLLLILTVNWWDFFEGGSSKGYYLKIGSKSFIPGFEEKLIGLNKGDMKTINLNFPKDYQASH